MLVHCKGVLSNVIFDDIGVQRFVVVCNASPLQKCPLWYHQHLVSSVDDTWCTKSLLSTAVLPVQK